jgi:hypothetical protein
MKFIPNAVGRVLGSQSLAFQKHSPTILFGTGVVGMVGSTVLACRATLKLEEVLVKADDDLSMSKRVAKERPDEYTEDDRKKDTALIYVRSAANIAKLYAPAVGVGILSVAALTKSHNILSERNAALTAAYFAVDKAFKEYRIRVVDKYGEAEDQFLRYSTEDIRISNEETGKDEIVVRVSPDATSMYAKFFDEFSPSWSKDPEVNFIFVRCQQNYANDLLKARGHVFLNEVYDMLGIPRTKAGSVVGWLLSDHSDNYIDFGVFDTDNPKARDFVMGREGSILLDFNVDGVIFDKIDTPKESISWQQP